MKNLQDLNKYLEEVGIFFLSTADGDQPKCRPLGFKLLYNDQLYFGVGEFKDVYKQLKANPKAEIVASKPQDWLRVYGEVVFDTDQAIVEAAFEAAPFLKSIYNEETGNKLGMFHLENATAEFRSMMQVEESFNF